MVLDGNAVRSVDRAAALLLALGESQGEAGVTELARRLGLHKSTASRLLATLQRRGLVEQDDETGKYRLGLVVIRLAERAERTLDLRGIAMPELERLARLTHETTGVGILDGESLLTVAQVDGPNLIAVGDWTGRSTPLHCVASGKVLMSSLAEREVLRIVRRGLIQYTERTIVELEPLLEELARIRRRGYATAIGEYELGLNAVSAPIHDARGNVIAAVDIWGPAFRLTPRRIPELAAQAREAAAAISVRLGGTVPERADHAPGPRDGLRTPFRSRGRFRDGLRPTRAIDVAVAHTIRPILHDRSPIRHVLWRSGDRPRSSGQMVCATATLIRVAGLRRHSPGTGRATACRRTWLGSTIAVADWWDRSGRVPAARRQPIRSKDLMHRGRPVREGLTQHVSVERDL